MKKYTSGFTLIELLVVIAIIGILSAVVLASLNSARNSANMANVKSQLSSFRNESEIFYNQAEGYRVVVSIFPISVCPPAYSSDTTNAASTGVSFLTVYPGTLFNAAVNDGLDGGVHVCEANQNSWVGSVQVKASPNEFFCADSTGFAGATSSTPSSGVYSCPQ